MCDRKLTDSTKNDSIVKLPVVKPVPPVHDVDSETSEKQGNSSISTEKMYQSFHSGEQMSLKTMSECSMVTSETDTVILSDSSDDKTETQQKIKDAVPSAGMDKTVAEPENKIENADKKKAQSENQQKMDDAVPSAGTDKTVTEPENKIEDADKKKAQSENQHKMDDAVPSAGTDKTVAEPENKIEDADKKKAQSENQQKIDDAVPSAGMDKTVAEPENKIEDADKKKAQSENQQKMKDAVPSAGTDKTTNKTVTEDEKKAQTDGAEEETIDNPQKSVVTESTGLLTGNNDIVSPAMIESTVLPTSPQVKVETSVVTESIGPQVKVETSTGLKASTGTSSPRSEYEDVFGPQINT